MEVRVEGDYYSPFIPAMFDDCDILSSSKADLASVNDIKPCASQDNSGCARQPLIE